MVWSVAPSVAASRTLIRTASNAGQAGACGPVGPVSSQNVGSYDDLYGVSEYDGSDVWAVGRYINASSSDRSLIERWNGQGFVQVPSADPQPNDVLFDVTSFLPSDVWAVGKTWPSTVDVDSPLVEHFDGTNWSAVPTPTPARGYGLLSGIAGASANDVWAVGSEFGATDEVAGSTLAEHWNGEKWQAVDTPNVGTQGSALSSVAVVSPSDAWAVGSHYTPNGNGKDNLIEHGNGTSWAVVPSPDVAIQDSLNGVAAISADDVWAVGNYFVNTPTGSEALTLILHFDGHSWSVVSSPSPGSDDNLFAVTAVSASDVWAVGGGVAASGLVEHWNGARWSVAREPSRTGNSNFLYAVTSGPGTGVWAAGDYAFNDTLVAHYCTP